MERLGYEVRVDEARLHGEADDAWVQAVVRVYLKISVIQMGRVFARRTKRPFRLM